MKHPFAVALSLLVGALLAEQILAQGLQQPIRWNAQYTQIYSDNIETISPSLGRAFALGDAGSLTADAAEVVAGARSIKGSYSGADTFTSFHRVLPFTPNHSYQVTFQYKIMRATSNGFWFSFLSPAGASRNDFLPGTLITGAAGTTGTATHKGTLGSYTDYYFFFGILGTGTISIDNIRISDGVTGEVITTEDAEGTVPTLKPGLQLQGATVVAEVLLHV